MFICVHARSRARVTIHTLEDEMRTYISMNNGSATQAAVAFGERERVTERGRQRAREGNRESETDRGEREGGIDGGDSER